MAGPAARGGPSQEGIDQIVSDRDPPDEHASAPTEPASLTCPSCGADLAPPGRFCVACGDAVGAHDAADGDEVTGALRAADDPADGADAAGADGAIDEPTRTVQTMAGPSSPPPASGRPAMRPCPSCQVDNVRTRVLCAFCGADLDGDDAATVPASARTQLSFQARRRHRTPTDEGRPWRWVWWVAVGLLAVGLVVGGLIVGELGPFAPEEGPLDPVAYPADRYPSDPQPLALASVATVTTRQPEADRSFSPEAMVDGDPTSAWHGDADELPTGTAEKLDVFFERPVWLNAIVLANGDHADAAAYAAAGRLQQVAVRFDGGTVIEATLLDLGRDLQRIEFEEPVLTTAVRLEVLEVVAGDERSDPAVSRLEFDGFPADEPDAELAEERAEERPAAGVITLTDGTPQLQLPGRS